MSKSEIEELSEALELRDQVQNERNELNKLSDDLDTTINEAESSMEELDSGAQENVQEAFKRSLIDTYEKIITSDEQFAPGEFEAEVGGFIEDVQSVLRHPEAESAVENIEEWLVAAGASPFEDDAREELIEIVERDVNRIEIAGEKAKSSLKTLQVDLGAEKSSLAQIVKLEFQDAESVSGIETIAGDLETTAEEWPYPLDVNLQGEAGKAVRNQCNQLMLNRIESIIDESESFDQFTTLARERIINQKGSINEVEDVVNKIEDRYDSLTGTPIGTPTDVAQERLEEALESATTISKVKESCKDILFILNVMNDVSTESIDRFKPPEDKVQSFIKQIISDIERIYNNLINTREDVLKGDVEEYNKAQDEFSNLIQEAESKLSTLQNHIEGEIKTAKELAETFDLQDKKASLNEIELAVSRANQVESLTQQADEYQLVRKEVRDIITEEHLNEVEAKVFELVLKEGGRIDLDKETIESTAAELDIDETNVLGIVLDLQNEGLVSVSIQSK
jgi:hypothetical protein